MVKASNLRLVQQRERAGLPEDEWYEGIQPPEDGRRKKCPSQDVRTDRSQIVGVEFRNALNALHLSANEFARLSGVTNRTVKRWVAETEPGRIPLWVDHMLFGLALRLAAGRRTPPLTSGYLRRYELVLMNAERLAAHLLSGDYAAAALAAGSLEGRARTLRAWLEGRRDGAEEAPGHEPAEAAS